MKFTNRFSTRVLLMGLVMMGCRDSETAKENAQPAATIEQAKQDPAPFQDLETAELLKLNQKWTGDFVRTHRAGTTFGNVLLKRYLGSAQRLRNPKVEKELRRFKTTAQFFRKYADRYDFDWLALAAQAYQEPRLDQNLRKKAAETGLAPNLWFNNVELIAARQIGRETVDYVSNIYKYYTVYKSIVDQEAEAKNASAKAMTEK